MSLEEESAGARTFTARRPRLGTRSSAALVYGLIVAMFAAPYLIRKIFQVPTEATFHWLHWLVLGGFAAVGLLLAASPWVRRSLFPKVFVWVTGNGLVVKGIRGRGHTFPMEGATLGVWTSGWGTAQGTALHVRDGRRRFVLGGEFHRAPSPTNFDAKPSRTVDAWLPASDFDTLLADWNHRTGRAGPEPVASAPIRCLLVPFTNFYNGNLAQPSLVIEVYEDGIKVIDPRANTAIASTPLSALTATPVVLRVRSRQMVGLVINIAGAPPVTVGIRDSRFRWRDAMQTLNTTPYLVSGADWLTLVDTCGLAGTLEFASPI